MIQSITVDLIPNGKMPMLHASQYDDGRQVRINLTENRQAYTLTGNEVLSLAVRKADNTLVTMDIANTYGGKSYVEFATTEQMTAVSGLNFGELTITNNGTKVGSLNFYLACEPSPEAGGLRSASEINNLNRQIDDHINEVLPEMVEDIAPAIVEEVAPAVVREEAPAVIKEVAPPIVEELVPIAVGDNYYNKTQTNEKIAELIDDTQVSANKAYSSDKVESIANTKANVSDLNVINNIEIKKDKLIKQFATAASYKLDGEGGSETDSLYSILRFNVENLDYIFVNFAADTIYQFQNTAFPFNPSYVVGDIVSGAVNGRIRVPSGAVVLCVSQLKTNFTNCVYNAVSEEDKINAKVNDMYALGGNLFDKDNANILYGRLISSLTIEGGYQYASVWIPIDTTKGDKFKITKNVSSNILSVGCSVQQPEINGAITKRVNSSDNTVNITVTEGANYLIVYCYNSSSTEAHSLYEVLGGLCIEYFDEAKGNEPYKYFDALRKTEIAPFEAKKFMQTARTPVVTLTDDDNTNMSGIDSLHTVCSNLGIKCTYACTTRFIEAGNEAFNQDLLDRYIAWQREGFHIATMSRTHGDHWKTESLNLAMIEDDIVRALVTLREQGFVDYDYLCTPNGQRAESVQALGKKWCKAMITGGAKLNVDYEDGRFNIHRIFIMSDASGGLTLNGYKALIDDCYEKGGWIVFGVHTSIVEEYDASLTSDVMQYALTKGCKVMPLNEAYKTKAPLYTWGECFN